MVATLLSSLPQVKATQQAVRVQPRAHFSCKQSAARLLENLLAYCIRFYEQEFSFPRKLVVYFLLLIFFFHVNIFPADGNNFRRKPRSVPADIRDLAENSHA